MKSRRAAKLRHEAAVYEATQRAARWVVFGRPDIDEEDLLQDAWILALERGEDAPTFGVADRKRLLGNAAWKNEMVSRPRGSEPLQRLERVSIEGLGIDDVAVTSERTTLAAAEQHNQVFPGQEPSFAAQQIQISTPMPILDLAALADEDCETAACHAGISMKTVEEFFSALRGLGDGRERGDEIPIDVYAPIEEILRQAQAAEHSEGFTREPCIDGVRVMAVDVVGGEIVVAVMESGEVVGRPEVVTEKGVEAAYRKHFYAATEAGSELHVVAESDHIIVRRPIKRATEDIWMATPWKASRIEGYCKDYRPVQTAKPTRVQREPNTTAAILFGEGCQRQSDDAWRSKYIELRGVDPGVGYFGIKPLLAAHTYLAALVAEDLNQNLLRDRTRLEARSPS